MVNLIDTRPGNPPARGWWACFVFICVLLPLASCADLPPGGQRETGAPLTYVYKQAAGRHLKLHVYPPPGTGTRPLPAVVFFHGGAWSGGDPGQFSRQAQWLSEHAGILSVTVEYRKSSLDHSTPLDSVEDARSAMCWVRSHARQFGVEPSHIAAAGGSAGGQLALATFQVTEGTVPGCAMGSSAQPNALILFNPVLEMKSPWLEKFAVDLETISPMRRLTKPLPPTILFQGTADQVTSYATARRFVDKARSLGSPEVVLVDYPNRGHGFFNAVATGDQASVLDHSRDFIRRLGW